MNATSHFQPRPILRHAVAGIASNTVRSDDEIAEDEEKASGSMTAPQWPGHSARSLQSSIASVNRTVFAITTFVYAAFLSMASIAPAATIDESYQYDALNRLTTAGAATYQHDAAGNLVQMTAPSTPSLFVTPSTTTMAYLANSTAIVSLTANVSWTASSNQTWLTVSPASGTTGTTLTLTSTTQNPTTSPRSAIVTITDGSLTSQVTVTQDGAPPPDTLVLTPTGLTIPSSAASGGSFAVAATGAWSASSNQSWLTLTSGSGTGNGTVTYNVTANNTASLRTAIVTVTGNSLTASYTLDQQAPISDDHGGDIATATPIPYTASSATGTLTTSDEDFFRVTVPYPGILIAWSEGDIDTYGHLYNIAGTQLDEDNDSDSGANFRVSAAVNAGYYYVRLRGNAADTTGNYALRTRFIPSAEPIQVSYLEKTTNDINIGFTGSEGVAYYILGSDDLDVWTQIGTMVGTGAENYATLVGQGGQPKRFFRVSTTDPATQPIILDAYNNSDNFTMGNYLFYPYYNAPIDNTQVIDGVLRICPGGESTAVHLWNGGQALTSPGDWVSIDLMSRTHGSAGLYVTGSLQNPAGGQEIRLYQNDTTLVFSGPWGDVPLSTMTIGSALLKIEVVQVARPTITLRATLSGSGFTTIIRDFDITANDVYFGLCAYSAYIENYYAQTVDNLTFFKSSNDFAHIPAGSFQMGDSFEMGDSLNKGSPEELPVHSVYVSGFFLQKTEVTKSQWDAVATWGAENGYDISTVEGMVKATNHPVYNVTWYNALKYCNARSQMEGLDPCYTLSELTYKTGENADVVCNWAANGYRLPTEAEWEKAARGGLNGKRFPWGDTISHSSANYRANGYPYDTNPYTDLTFHPDYSVNGYPYTSPVMTFAPNGYGLYDMCGNMAEMCWDWFDSSYYASSPTIDPRGADSGMYRVVRGGSWLLVGSGCTTSFRFMTPPDNSNGDGIHVGIRPARNLVP